MDTERLRGDVVGGCNKLLEAPLVKRFMSADQRRLTRAQRRYWELAGQSDLDRLARLLEQEPRRADDDDEPEEGEA